MLYKVPTVLSKERYGHEHLGTGRLGWDWDECSGVQLQDEFFRKRRKAERRETNTPWPLTWSRVVMMVSKNKAERLTGNMPAYTNTVKWRSKRVCSYILKKSEKTRGEWSMHIGAKITRSKCAHVQENRISALIFMRYKGVLDGRKRMLQEIE